MIIKKKKLSDYTDRELMEKNVAFLKNIADNTEFVKIYLILMTLVSFIISVVLISKLK